MRARWRDCSTRRSVRGLPRGQTGEGDIPCGLSGKGRVRRGRGPGRKKFPILREKVPQFILATSKKFPVLHGARRESSPKTRGEPGFWGGGFMAVACFLGLRTSSFKNFNVFAAASGPALPLPEGPEREGGEKVRRRWLGYCGLGMTIIRHCIVRWSGALGKGQVSWRGSLRDPFSSSPPQTVERTGADGGEREGSRRWRPAARIPPARE